MEPQHDKQPDQQPLERDRVAHSQFRLSSILVWTGIVAYSVALYREALADPNRELGWITRLCAINRLGRIALL